MELEYNGYRIFLYPLLDSSLSDKEIRSFSIKNKGVNLGCAMPRLLKDRTLWNFQGKKILSLDTSGECFCFQPSSNSTWDEIPREQVEFLAIPIREYAEEDDFIGEIVYDPF